MTARRRRRSASYPNRGRAERSARHRHGAYIRTLYQHIPRRLVPGTEITALDTPTISTA